MLKQVFLGRFEPVVKRFGLWKSQNALKMGRFGTKNVSKTGQKHFFAEVILDYSECSNKCFHPKPEVTCFGPWKIPKCCENGPTRDQKWVKNGFKTHWSKSDRGPFGMLKEVFLARFEPVRTCFGPWVLHPSPLKSSQQAKEQQALLLSVLAIAPFQRFASKQASKQQLQALLLSVLAIAPPHRSKVYSIYCSHL